MGSDLHDYILKKASQNERLGFAERPYELKMVISAQSDDEIVDWSLGSRTLQASNVSAAEVRFGISIPLNQPPHSDDVQIKITPHPVDHCQIEVRAGDVATTPIMFEGDIFIPTIPVLDPNLQRFIIRTDAFEITLWRRGSMNLSVSPPERQTISSWIKLFSFLRILSEGGGQAIFRPGKLTESSIDLVIDESDGSTGVEATTYYEWLVKLFEKADRLLRLSGSGDVMTSVPEIIEKENSIVSLEKLFRSSRASALPLRIKTARADGDLHLPKTVDFTVVDHLPLGDATIAFCVIADMNPELEADGITWIATKVTPKRLSAMRNLPTEYQAFVDLAIAQMTTAGHIIRGLGSPNVPTMPQALQSCSI